MFKSYELICLEITLIVKIKFKFKKVELIS
jgi:hypothetical protein